MSKTIPKRVYSRDAMMIELHKKEMEISRSKEITFADALDDLLTPKIKLRKRSSDIFF